MTLKFVLTKCLWVSNSFSVNVITIFKYDTHSTYNKLKHL